MRDAGRHGSLHGVHIQPVSRSGPRRADGPGGGGQGPSPLLH